MNTVQSEAFLITASEVMAAVALSLFPGVQLVGGGLGHEGFYYDFIMEKPLSPEQILYFEESVLQFCRKAHRIAHLEMVPQVAESFLKKHGHALRAGLLGEEEPLVHIFQMDFFVDAREGPFLKDTAPIQSFKIAKISQYEWEIEGKKKQITRVFAWAFQDKRELKSFLKVFKDLRERDHAYLGEHLKLFMWHGDQLFWLPRGEEMCRAFLEFWRQEVEKEKLLLVSTPWGESDISHQILYKSFKAEQMRGFAETQKVIVDPKPAMTLFDVNEFLTDCSHFFCRVSECEKEIVSSLQFIEKIANVLNLKYKVVLYLKKGVNQSAFKRALDTRSDPYFLEKGAKALLKERVEWHVQDIYGKWWPISRLESISFTKEIACFAQTAFISLERMMALAIESKGDAVFF